MRRHAAEGGWSSSAPATAERVANEVGEAYSELAADVRGYIAQVTG